jgi:tRNA modification GTPase
MVFTHNNDSIVALSSPKGIGAISLIRISGNSSISIVDGLFPSKNLQNKESHTIHVGSLTHQGEIIDEVVVSLFKSPKSFTGENTVEISCHGSTYIQSRIIDILIESGCRLAKPGEFTMRAFLNGKLDLTQAEAVADLIESNTLASKNNAIRNIRGGFKSDLSSLRQQLVHISAMIELELDFATEDVEFIDRNTFIHLVDELILANNTLLNSFKLGNVLKNGIQVAIIGKPNTGKSTLLNTLLNEK